MRDTGVGNERRGDVPEGELGEGVRNTGAEEGNGTKQQLSRWAARACVRGFVCAQGAQGVGRAFVFLRVIHSEDQASVLRIYTALYIRAHLSVAHVFRSRRRYWGACKRAARVRCARRRVGHRR